MSAAASLGTYADWAAHRVESLDRRYRGDVLAYCRRRLPSREEAEDAAQVVFLNAYRSLAAGVRPESDSAWLYGIAGHVVAHRLRTIARRARVEVPTDVATLNVPAPAASGAELGQLDVAAAVRELPDLERRAFFLREWQGLSYSEVAAELGVTDTAVAALLRSGRRRVAGNLNWQRRRMSGLSGLCVPWPLLKWLSGSGTAALKIGAGAASIAVIAVAGPPVGEYLLHGGPAAPPHRIVTPVRHTTRARIEMPPRAISVPHAAQVVERAHARPRHTVTTVRHSWPIVSSPRPIIPNEVTPPPAATPDPSSVSPIPADSSSTAAPSGAPAAPPSVDDTREPSVMPATAAVCSRRSTPANAQGNGDPSGPVCPG